METKAVQMLSKAAREEIRSMGHKRFSYGRIFELAEQANERYVMPHKLRAIELGIDEEGIVEDEIPVSPVLTKLKDTMHRLEQMYSFEELRLEGIDISAMLTYMTEQEVIEELEERGVEQAVALSEVEAFIVMEEWQIILSIPKIKRDFFNLRQMEETTPGHYADISAFNTVDYLNESNNFEFDKFRYMADKVAERAEDLAIMHSCITSDEGKSRVRQNFIAHVNCRYRNYALRLLSAHNATNDEAAKAELREKIEKQNRQIRRLKAIWEKFAHAQ